MDKHDGRLFQIGEVVKILGVTRRMVLHYEEMGLLEPDFKDEKTGYRYYTANNMVQIRYIRSLQDAGLSLKEIKEYRDETESLDRYINRLMELRAALDRNIQSLQERAAKKGDLSVHRVILPRQVCFCREFPYGNVADTANNLRDTYIAAARSGKMSVQSRMFTVREAESKEGKAGILSEKVLCCIPVEDNFNGAERREFAQIDAICIYHRGPYEGIKEVMKTLAQYACENGMKTAGSFRSVYLEGPPTRGNNVDEYITMVAMPILEF